MKIIFPFIGVLILLLLVSGYVSGQQSFLDLPNSSDSSFGYSITNPLNLKRGKKSKSIDYTVSFLKGLRTKDDQNLLLVQRTIAIDTNFKLSFFTPINRSTGLPLNGKTGILDKYVFVTSNTTDTVTIFVNIYRKERVEIPMGLKYVIE